MYRFHYVLQRLLAVLGVLLQDYADLASSLLLSDHEVQVEYVVEHVLHVAPEYCVEFPMKLFGMVLRFRDAIGL